MSWKAEKLKDFFTSLKATTESETETPADAANGKVRAAWQPSGTIWWGETQFTPEVKGDAEQLTIEGLEPNAYRVALEAWVPTEGTPEEGSWEVASEFVRVSVTPKKEEPEQRVRIVLLVWYVAVLLRLV